MDDENAGLAHAEQGTTRMGEGKASARKRGIAARGAGGAAYFASLLAIALIAATPVQARVTRIVIGTTESPTFGGTSFGAVGKYEKLRGVAYGEVDPGDPKNAIIADIALAPRNAGGKVEYAVDFLLFRPVDPSKGNGRILYEPANRGTTYVLNLLNDALTGGADPMAAADAGNGFLMRQGFSVVSSGWDVTAASGAGRLTMTVPVAVNADASTIVAPSIEEFVIYNLNTSSRSVPRHASPRHRPARHANLTRRKTV